MLNLLENIKKDGNSIGGIVECHIKNVPVWLWEPIFWKIKSILASSMLSIWAIVGFEYWEWFNIVNLTWETYNEWFKNKNWKIVSEHNNYGWILWGITTWEDIKFRVAVKPTPSIYKIQKTIDTSWNKVDFQIKWEHDSCILPRIIPVVEAMCAINILDLIMINWRLLKI
jgi:chorismate synthase